MTLADVTDLSRRVGGLLARGGLSVCAAESCTGGLILSTLTDVSGSSAYVEGGLVTYSNEAKMQRLGVCEETLIRYGAVSEATAAEMAKGARALVRYGLRLERHRHRGTGRRHRREAGRADVYRAGGT